MTRQVLVRWTRTAFALFLVIWLFARIFHGFGNLYRDADTIYDWNVFYWLIVWPGYYVRRGLNGEIILFLSSLFAVDPRIILLCLHAAVSAAFAYTLWMISKHQSIVAFPLVVSPVGMTLDILDSEVVLRHDVLFLLFYALVCYLMAVGRATWASVVAFAGALIWPFVHEGLALYVPWLLVPLLLCDQPRGTRDRMLGLRIGTFVFLWAAGLIVNATWAEFGSDAEVVRDVCLEVQDRASDLPHVERCLHADAIRFLQTEVTDAVRMMLIFMAEGEFNRNFAQVVGFVVLSAALFVFVVRELTGVVIWREWRSYMAKMPKWYVVFLVVPCGLFFISYDWGRWIRIYCLILGIHSLMLTRAVRADEKRIEQAERPGRVGTLFLAGWIGLVSEPLFWRLQHYQGAEPGLMFHVQKTLAEAILRVSGIR